MSMYGTSGPRSKLHKRAATYAAYIPDRQVDTHPGNEPSRTQQQFRDECDIHNVLKRHLQTGQVEHLNRGTPQWGELGDGLDFEEAMQTVTMAQQSFETLPADTRARFENSPARFLDFMSKEENLEEIYKMGLLERPPKPPEAEPPQPPAETPEPPPAAT